MSHQADMQATHEELAAWKRRCAHAEAAAKDAYEFMHEDVFPLANASENVQLVVAATRVTSRLYPVVRRNWCEDFRKWF